MATTATSTPAPPTTQPPTTDTNTNFSHDPWTPDQELTLLKALVKYKPVGLHAHFRMLSIHQHLLSSGTCNSDDEHTRIPGIWAKLRTLYDLEQLNEREDAVVMSSTASAAEEVADEDVTGGLGYWRDFELGGEGDFEGLMWERRLAPEGTPGSPEWAGVASGSGSGAGAGGGGRAGRGRRESTVPGTDEPRSSPVAAAGTRGTTRSGRRGGRVSRLKGEAEASEGRSSRRDSKAASEVGTKDEDGDENMEDVDEDEDGSGDGEDDEEESEEEEEDEKRSTPARRGRGGRRGRGRRGRRRG